MGLKQINTGILIDGKEVIEIELTNTKGTLVGIYNYGTIIHRFVVKNKLGVDQDIVLGFDDFSGYVSEDYLKDYTYFGAIIGRYANRIGNGQFLIDENHYQLPQNNGNACLHGGLEGFDKKVWDIIEVTEEPLPKVTFQYYSVDGEEGFPGDLAVQLSFTLTDNDELILNFTADTDEATPVNLTHHSYFNLSPTGENVKDHIVQIHAKNYLAQDQDYVVTGNLVPVAETAFDFTKPKAIGADWDPEEGYDQTFVLDKNYGDLTLASTVSETNSGLSLLIYSTEPVAHLYTAKYVAVNSGKGGKTYKGFEAFCVEMQHHPNAINIPEFPTTILQPEEQYHQTTIYKINQS